MTSIEFLRSNEEEGTPATPTSSLKLSNETSKS
jgi:hypothetical protein